MKKVLTLGGVLAFAGMLMLWATPGADHKVFWCHYPPGQWTGDPATSKVIILEIDKAARGWEKETNKHIGHSPVILDGQGNFLMYAEGETSDGSAANCPRPQPPQEVCGTAANGANPPVQLVGTPPSCVCPSGTVLAGSTPIGGSCYLGEL